VCDSNPTPLLTPECHEMCDYRRGMGWWMDLLTTYTHHLEIQVITTLSLISTLYKSLQHPLSFFQPAMSSPAVPWQRLLTVDILQLHVFRFDLHSFPCRTQLTTINWTVAPAQLVAPLLFFLWLLDADLVTTPRFPRWIRNRYRDHVFISPLPRNGSDITIPLTIFA
jgi:hypothetical protein